MKKQKKAFSIIEIIIGIFIFSLGISSIYMIISSSLNSNIYNKNQIIAGNLARETIEQIRNIRDSNYATYHKWNQKGPHLDYEDEDSFFKKDTYYKIENDFLDTSTFPIKVEEIDGLVEGAENIADMENYRLCLDEQNVYTYDCNGNTKTDFYRYAYFDDLKYTNNSGDTEVIDETYKVTVKVIWTIKGYHEFKIDTIIADWKRL